MKILIVSLLLIISTSTAFSQQFLWSTIKDSGFKYVPYEDVTYEVLEFYDFYQYYYDGAGYSKESFFKSLESSPNFKNMKSSSWEAFKKAVKNIKKPSVFAIRHNTGKGSVVSVFCVNNDHVNVIIFTNTYEDDINTNTVDERGKFTRWFKTLLN